MYTEKLPEGKGKHGKHPRRHTSASGVAWGREKGEDPGPTVHRLRGGGPALRAAGQGSDFESQGSPRPHHRHRRRCKQRRCLEGEGLQLIPEALQLRLQLGVLLRLGRSAVSETMQQAGCSVLADVLVTGTEVLRRFGGKQREEGDYFAIILPLAE